MAYWWVNQNEDDYPLLEEEDLLVVPRRDKLGRTNSGYVAAGEMKPGDIGFVFVGGELDGVFAVSMAAQDDTVEMAPEFQRRPARVAQVAFFDLPEPVRVEETTLRLRDLLPPLNSPLQPDGAGRDTTVYPVGEALAQRLLKLASEADPLGAALNEAAAEAIAASDLTEEQKAELIGARLGVGPFGDAVLALWGGACAATGVTIEPLIHISAIKPWVYASNEERLDEQNGLPLVPTWAVVFSGGLVAFDDDGALLLSSELPPEDARKAGIDPDFRLAVKGERQRTYLAWHRHNVFLAS
jgi:hypothetical protein